MANPTRLIHYGTILDPKKNSGIDICGSVFDDAYAEMQRRIRILSEREEEQEYEKTAERSR